MGMGPRKPYRPTPLCLADFPKLPGAKLSSRSYERLVPFGSITVRIVDRVLEADTGVDASTYRIGKE